MVIHQTATHKCYLFGSSAILKSRTDLANLKVRQRESPRLAKSWQPSNHHPLSAAITRHAQPHQPCFATPLATLWGRSQTQKANLYSFAHLVCSCLLSMLWDRLLAANRRQTLVCMLGCCAAPKSTKIRQVMQNQSRTELKHCIQINSSWTQGLCCLIKKCLSSKQKQELAIF